MTDCHKETEVPLHQLEIDGEPKVKSGKGPFRGLFLDKTKLIILAVVILILLIIIIVLAAVLGHERSKNRGDRQPGDITGITPKKVCYGKYGCFDRHPVWSVRLPQKPSHIGTKFNLFTRNNSKSAQIIDDHDKSKLSDSYFNISRRTIFVIHGFTENISTWAPPMKDALLDREDCNVILVDWSKGASFPRIQATGNARLVGAQTAELIRFLISSHSGSPDFVDRFYIVGFSLGAQTAGYAGSYLRAYGMQLGRITGLDPTGPYFSNVTKDFRLDQSDARYVDVIHTNMGHKGTDERCGNIDFYPNGGSQQPGCPIGVLIPPCDHRRARQYYTASVIGSCLWTAYPCANYAAFEAGRCLKCNGACPSIGYAADRTKQNGTFYLTTNEKVPFCGKTQRGD